ncbi:hypothetical protein Tco_1173154 [Tanacetum coccineum]
MIATTITTSTIATTTTTRITVTITTVTMITTNNKMEGRKPSGLMETMDIMDLIPCVGSVHCITQDLALPGCWIVVGTINPYLGGAAQCRACSHDGSHAAARSALERLWPLAFPGVKSDRGVVDLIDADIEDGNIVKILIASIHAGDQECDEIHVSLEITENK